MSDVPTRLLRAALRGTAAEPSSSCLDAATLAAWADGSLGSRERVAVESHAAGCARCQTLLAAMVKTAPPPSPPRVWWTSKIAWLAPIAAAAAALVVWIAVPGQPMRAPAPASLTTRESQASQTPAAAAPTTRAATVAPPAAEAPVASPQARREVPLPPAPSAAAPQRRQAVPPSASSKELRDAASPAAPVASADLHLERSSTRAAGATTDAKAKPSEVESRQLAEAAAPPAALESLRARSVMQNAAKAVSPFEITSPDPNVRWRVVSGTNVQRSVDAGANWQAQSSGVRAVLSSGTAPSSTVCWIVGAAGTVARSIDGRTWQRVGFPEAIDLSAVRASDAMHAVVTAADGRTFATDDGGRTWQVK